MKKIKSLSPNLKPATVPTTKPEVIKAESLTSSTSKPQPVPITMSKAENPKPGRVSFELVKPGAKRVCVAGSFNDWKPETAPLVPKDNGRWVGDLTIKPGRYEYLFVVDGQWLPDPRARESVQNPFGGRNSVLGVSGGEAP